MEKVTDIKQYAINKAKAGYSMVGQECVRLEKLDRHGDQALKAIFKEINLHEERKIVFHAWPNLQVACIKFCELVTRQYPGVKAPLADETIEKAFVAYDLSTRCREPEIYSMVRFLNVLADASSAIQMVSVYAINGKGDAIPWPYFAQPISTWARKLDVDEVCFSPAPAPSGDEISGGRDFLCAHIMTITDIGKMKALNGMLQPLWGIAV